jgi:hypothetical protein
VKPSRNGTLFTALAALIGAALPSGGSTDVPGLLLDRVRGYRRPTTKRRLSKHRQFRAELRKSARAAGRSNIRMIPCPGFNPAWHGTERSHLKPGDCRGRR